MKYIMIAIVFLMIASNAAALRCGNNLAQVGMTQTDIIGNCGRPDLILDVETRETKVGRTKRIRKVTKWVYSKLSHGEIHYMKFVGDVLTEITWSRK